MGWQDAPAVESASTEPKPKWADAPSLHEEKGPETSALGAFLRSAVRATPGALAGIAAFGPGASLGAAGGAAVSGGNPVAGVVGGVAGGLAASAAASSATNLAVNGLLHMIPQDVLATVGLDDATLKADLEQHPIASFAGDMAPNVATGKIGRAPISARVAGAGIGAATEGAREAVTGETVDPLKIAASAAIGGTLHGQNRMGKVVADIGNNAAARLSAISARNFGESLKEVHHQKTQEIEAKKMEVVKNLKQNKGLQQHYQDVREELTHSDDPAAKLSPKAAQFKQQVIDPVAQDVGQIRERIRAYGVDVGEDLEHYLPRITVDSQKRSIFETVGGVLPGGPTQKTSFGTKASSLNDRTAVALDGPSGRMIATRDAKSGKMEIWRDGQVVGGARVNPKEWHAGQFEVMGVPVQKAQASVREIESHTPIRYYHDPIAALVDTKFKLEKVLTNLDFLHAMQHAPEAKSVMAHGKIAEKAPADWRTVEGMPRSFAATKFEPRVAESLEDIIGKTGDGFLDQVGNVSRFVTVSMFWNPMPHIWNVASHFAVEKGLVGGAVGAVKGTAKTLVNPSSNLTFQAIKSVVTRDDNYMRFLKSGAGMMSPGPFNRDFALQVMTALGKQPEAQGLAKAWGYLNPREMIKGVYGAANKGMWSVNDMMLMQAYLAKEQSGMTAAQAIKDVERHIPNYQMPSRVLMDNRFGRMISKGLQSPSVVAFGRYEHNRLASYGRMMTDAISRDTSIKDRAHALDQMAMLAFSTYVFYPLVMDTMAKAMTGNEDATATRFGANAIPFWIDQYFHADDREFNKTYGTKSVAEIAQSMFVPAPGLKTTMELWTNTDTFKKKPLIEGAGDIPGFALDHALPPIREIHDIVAGKKSIKQSAEKDFLGVNDPSASQLRKRDAWFVKQRAADLRKKKKKENE